MRVSTDPGDPGFAAWASAVRSGKAVRVFFEGTELRCCHTADEEARQVVQAVLDERGAVVFDPISGEFPRRTLHGHVRIELTPA